MSSSSRSFLSLPVAASLDLLFLHQCCFLLLNTFELFSLVTTRTTLLLALGFEGADLLVELLYEWSWSLTERRLLFSWERVRCLVRIWASGLER
jgi:hypothetical protein